MIVDVHARPASHTFMGGRRAVLCRYVWSRPIPVDLRSQIPTTRFPGSYAYGGWHVCWQER